MSVQLKDADVALIAASLASGVIASGKSEYLDNPDKAVEIFNKMLVALKPPKAPMRINPSVIKR